MFVYRSNCRNPFKVILIIIKKVQKKHAYKKKLGPFQSNLSHHLPRFSKQEQNPWFVLNRTQRKRIWSFISSVSQSATSESWSFHLTATLGCDCAWSEGWGKGESTWPRSDVVHWALRNCAVDVHVSGADKKTAAFPAWFIIFTGTDDQLQIISHPEI